MATNVLTGKDTIQINDRVLVDFADGDVLTLTYPNDRVAVKTGKNQNTIFAENATGQNADVEMRIIRGSADDKFLNSLLFTQDRDLSAFVLLTGQFIKKTGDGKAGVSRTIYDLKGGVFKKRIDAKDNVEGDTEQGVSLYRLTFANALESIA